MSQLWDSVTLISIHALHEESDFGVSNLPYRIF